MRVYFNLWILLVVFLTSFTPSVAAQDTVSVNPTGRTTVSAKLNGSNVQVSIQCVRIGRSQILFPDLWDTNEVSVVSKLEIAVNGRRVIVPRSAFLGLFDATEASLRFEKGNFVLEVDGADAANSYFILVHFDTTRVKRRLSYSKLDPQQPSEDTQYRLIVIGDK